MNVGNALKELMMFLKLMAIVELFRNSLASNALKAVALSHLFVNNVVAFK